MKRYAGIGWCLLSVAVSFGWCYVDELPKNRWWILPCLVWGFLIGIASFVYGVTTIRETNWR